MPSSFAIHALYVLYIHVHTYREEQKLISLEVFNPENFTAQWTSRGPPEPK